VERRYAVFIALSLAAVLSSQVMRSILFPQAEEKPPVVKPVVDGSEKGQQDPVKPKEERDPTPAEPTRSAGDPPANESGSEGPSDSEPSVTQSAPRRHLSLGSLNPDAPAGMLVTLSSRGATVERIELAGEQFHDQDDRGAYIGHFAADVVPEGCRLTVVGDGTPAKIGGLQAGDVVVRVADSTTPDPQSLATVLARLKPRQIVSVTFRRPQGEALGREQV